MNWSTRWAMPFNVAKCHVMHTGRRNPEYRYRYSMGGYQLEKTESERDVGVISKDLRQEAQTRKATATATTVLHQKLVLRSFHYRDRHVFKRLYTTYVWPHLEFVSPAWTPWIVPCRTKNSRVCA